MKIVRVKEANKTEDMPPTSSLSLSPSLVNDIISIYLSLRSALTL